MGYLFWSGPGAAEIAGKPEYMDGKWVMYQNMFSSFASWSDYEHEVWIKGVFRGSVTIDLENAAMVGHYTQYNFVKGAESKVLAYVEDLRARGGPWAAIPNPIRVTDNLWYLYQYEFTASVPV